MARSRGDRPARPPPDAFTLKITVTRYLPQAPRAVEPAAAWGEEARCLAPADALALGVPQPLRRLLERAVDSLAESGNEGERRIGVAKGKFEVLERIDGHDKEIERLLRGGGKP